MRHIIRLVAEAIAEEKHPEGKNALELQNRLIGEAIKIHNLIAEKNKNFGLNLIEKTKSGSYVIYHKWLSNTFLAQQP